MYNFKYSPIKEAASSEVMTMSTKQKFITGFSLIGVTLTVLEILSYIILFHYLSSHNKNIASGTNAIKLYSLSR